MIYSDYYTSTDTGRFLCVLFFYAVYPIISVNFSTYILLVLNQFLVIRRPLAYGSQVGKQEVTTGKLTLSYHLPCLERFLENVIYYGLYMP